MVLRNLSASEGKSSSHYEVKPIKGKMFGEGSTREMAGIVESRKGKTTEVRTI